MERQSLAIYSGFAGVLLCLGVIAFGCGGDPAPPGAVCTAYATQECVGPAACPGGQMCKADGSGWMACDCGPAVVANAPALNACSPDLKASTQTCVDSSVIRSGTWPYWLNNNVWGRSPNDTVGEQCIWLDCLTGDSLALGSSWHWNVGT